MRPPFSCQRNSFWRALQRVSSYFQFSQTIVSVIITTGTGNLHDLYSYFFQTSKYLIYVAIRINERTILSTLNIKPNPVFYIVHQHSTRKSHKWIDKYNYVQYFHTYSRFRTLKCHLETKTAYISLLKLSCQKFDVLRTRRSDI